MEILDIVAAKSQIAQRTSLAKSSHIGLTSKKPHQQNVK
jgi:hypothetical protein